MTIPLKLWLFIDMAFARNVVKTSLCSKEEETVQVTLGK